MNKRLMKRATGLPLMDVLMEFSSAETVARLLVNMGIVVAPLNDR